MKTFLLLTSLACLSIAQAQPFDVIGNGEKSKLSSDVLKPRRVPELTDGDMILTPEQKKFLYSKERNGVSDPNKHWPEATVYYLIDSNFHDYEKYLIHSAFEDFQRKTCVKFIKATSSQTDYINVIKSGNECSSSVGYVGGVQIVNLARKCLYFGGILHFFNHALGFYHQENTYNRDDFVTIHLENVISGQEKQFQKYTDQEVNNYGEGYDYYSVMHSRHRKLSKNGKFTITTEYDDGAFIGQRYELSEKDVKKIIAMYNCPK